MPRQAVQRLMDAHEFKELVVKIAGGSKWLDRLHILTAIEKASLKQYETGDRLIPNSHALFIRQIYLLQTIYPDLFADISLLMRKPSALNVLNGTYKKLEGIDKTNLLKENHELKKRLDKISRLASYDD